MRHTWLHHLQLCLFLPFWQRRGLTYQVLSWFILLLFFVTEVSQSYKMLRSAEWLIFCSCKRGCRGETTRKDWKSQLWPEVQQHTTSSSWGGQVTALLPHVNQQSWQSMSRSELSLTLTAFFRSTCPMHFSCEGLHGALQHHVATSLHWHSQRQG